MRTISAEDGERVTVTLGPREAGDVWISAERGEEVSAAGSDDS